MTDLTEMVEWLRREVKSDKAAAFACMSKANPGEGHWTFAGMQVRDDRGHLVVQHTWPNEGAHIATHDPRDTIARCEAELAIVGKHRPVPCPDGLEDLIVCSYCGPTGDDSGAWPVSRDPDYLRTLFWPCDLIKDLAHGYRHRPGWKETWMA